MTKKVCILWVLIFVSSGLFINGCAFISSKPVGATTLQIGSLDQAGFDTEIFKSVDKIIQEAVDKNDTPGAVLIVGKDNMIVYEKAYGNRRLRPHIEPMTADTIFDLASCSKVLGTSTMAMLLIQDGKLQLEAKVSDILPQFAQNEKGDVTVWNLLTHTTGLPAYCDWKEAEKLRGNKTQDDALIDYIASLKKRYPTGEYYLYSCLNFLTLARVNETIAGESMHSFLKRRVWDPLNMTSSGYLLTPEQKQRTATTTEKNSLDDIGIVHDPLARYHKATDKHCPGNAGLFMSSGDMAVMAQLILNKGIYNGVRIFKPETVDLWTKPQIFLPIYDAKKQPDHKGDMVRRALAWINYQEPPYLSKNAPEGSAIGHTGWTGTYIWMDRHAGTFVIFNSNCVHANPDPKIGPYRKRIIEVVQKSLNP